jgi:hypothetical protein
MLSASLKISYLIIKMADQHQNQQAYPNPYIDLVSKVRCCRIIFQKINCRHGFGSFLSLHVLEARSCKLRKQFVKSERRDAFYRDGQAWFGWDGVWVELFRLRLNTSRNSRFAHLVWTFQRTVKVCYRSVFLKRLDDSRNPLPLSQLSHPVLQTFNPGESRAVS